MSASLLLSFFAAVTLATGDLPQGSKLLRGSCTTPDGRQTYLVHTIGRYWLPVTQVDRGWCHNAAMSIFDARTGKYLNTVLLDDPDRGAAEPWDVICDEKEIVVAHAGSSELSFIDRKAFEAKLESAKGRDLSTDLSFLVGLRRRQPTEKQGPRKLMFHEGRVVVTEYLADKPGITRGELLFNDARECFQQWQSCATCHPDGRSDGLKWSFPGKKGLGAPELTCDLVTRDIPLVKLHGMMMADFKSDLFAEPDEAKAAELAKYVRSVMDRK